MSVHQRHGVSRGGSAEGSGGSGLSIARRDSRRDCAAKRPDEGRGPEARLFTCGVLQLARSVTRTRRAFRDRSFEPRAQAATGMACTPSPRAQCAEIGAQGSVRRFLDAATSPSEAVSVEQRSARPHAARRAGSHSDTDASGRVLQRAACVPSLSNIRHPTLSHPA